MSNITITKKMIKKQKRKQVVFDLITRGTMVSREKMARYAFANTEFYKKLYKNLPPGFFFDKLPIVTKHILSDVMPFDLLSRTLEKRVFKYGETTGSTGNPTPSFYTKKEFMGSALIADLTPLREEILDNLEGNRRAVCGLACGFTVAGISFQQILDRLGMLTINVDARTTIAPPSRVARLLSRFSPGLIAAGETDFLAWMKILKEEHFSTYKDVVDNLKVLLSTAELCSENRSARIAEFFNIRHIDNYACVEGYFSLPCPCGEKHILPIYHTEVMNHNLDKSTQWGSGRFVFTNLIRKSTPFVRYLLDDYVTIYRSHCPYGYTRSIQPHGRYELTVTIGGVRYGIRHFENLLFKDYLFGEYQVEISARSIRIQAEDYQQGIIPRKKIIEDFTRVFGLKTELKVVPYGTLRDYRAIRKSKPLLRLLDLRRESTQQIPRYM